MPSTQVDALDFAVMCIYVRIIFKDVVPVTPRMVIMALLDSRYEYYASLLIIDDVQDLKSMLYALVLIAKVMNTEMNAVIRLALSMSSDAVIEVNGEIVLKGIRCTTSEIDVRLPTQLGGFTDDGIVSEPPGASAQKQQWANDLVFVVSDSESPTAEPSPSKAAAQRNSTKKSKPANVPTAPSTPVPIKREESASSQPRSISSANSDALLLPRFVQADWIPRFIPTLYHCLLSSDNPFLDFQRGNAEKTIKLVLDTVIPGNTYEVEWEGKLCQMAYERTCEMRSKFGRSAMKNIRDFFDGPEYKDKPEAIRRYVQWAVRKDGPMLWRVPGPQELPKDPGPEHKPVDIFQLPFIINIVTPTLRCLQASVGHHVFGEPKVAFALATAGVHGILVSAITMFLIIRCSA
ncbi:hypothetical protein LshimejAT787_1501130 [Lyophyllum shimeji]|uniref:Uncharacterized protein n=1 Tax=Lyophyllum shimeji TaxID=47721 RepID=A0A9P3UQH2_LYOSH|nr:hypothetical protein LshimejAT787_1501130 [Lyophyllum shimeji]